MRESAVLEVMLCVMSKCDVEKMASKERLRDE